MRNTARKTAFVDLFNELEWEIIAYIGQCKDSHEIGKLLNLRPKTIKNKRSEIHQKLDTHNTLQMARKLYFNGINIFKIGVASNQETEA